MTDLSIPDPPSELPKRPLILAGVVGMLLLLYLLAATGGLPLLRLLGLGRPFAVYFFSNRTLFWVCVGLAWWYAVKVEKQPLLLWRERRQGIMHYAGAMILLAVVIYICLFIANLLIYMVTHKTEQSETVERLIRYCRAHPFLLFYSVVTAGVTEELLFRGYLLPRLELFTGNRNAAILISSLLFGLGHYHYGTVRNVVGAMIIGLVLAVYYDRWRNIKVIILFHILWDTAVFYLSFRHR